MTAKNFETQDLLCLPQYIPITIRSGLDRYGFSSVLAQNCRLQFVPRSFANWVHGWIWDDSPTSYSLHCRDLPKDLQIVVRSSTEMTALTNEGFSRVKVGGLPFCYVDRQYWGDKNNWLLAVLPHSSERQKLTKPFIEYLDYLESVRRDFERVAACIYYLDADLIPRHEFKKRNLHLICGARPDDKNSLRRMRAIFDNFKYVTSAHMGSHVLYAGYSGCIVSLCGPHYGDEHVLGSLPLNPTKEDLRLIARRLYVSSEDYLKERFGFLYCSDPLHGKNIREFAVKQIGESEKLCEPQILAALGWTFTGQVRGYYNGVVRRAIRMGLK